MSARKTRRTPRCVARRATGRTHCSVVLCMAALVAATAAVRVDAWWLQSCSVPRRATASTKRTVATQAAANGNLPCIVDLIEAGADVDKADMYGYTPLYAAAGRMWRRR